MRKISALAVLIACWATAPATSWASSPDDCSAQWQSADGNKDGVLMGPEADRYLAFYRVRAQVTPADGRISQDEFMKACENDVFMAKAPEASPPVNGADSFTEGQAQDRAKAAGFIAVSSLVKDGDGIWRGSAMKDGKAAKIAIDFKGNVTVSD
jgi:hypothetical protein